MSSTVSITESVTTVNASTSPVEVTVSPSTVSVTVSTGPIYLGGADYSAATGSGSPVGVVTPDFVGQLYFDTSSGLAYAAPSLNSSDWFEIVRNW